MKRRPIAERLERLESDCAAKEKDDMNLSILTDAELQALTDAVHTGTTTPAALAAIDKARTSVLEPTLKLGSELGKK